MNTILTAAAVGGLAGTGMILFVSGLRASQPALQEVLNAASTPRPPASTRTRRVTERLASVGTEPSGLAADLAVLGRTPTEFATARFTLAGVLGGVPAGFAILTGAAGGLAWNPVLVITASLLGATVGLVGARTVLAAEAAQRRRGFAVELATYLDLVAQLISGGAGVTDALWRAARPAVSPGLVMIRDTLASARVRRISEWDALGELAHGTRVNELLELVTATKLAGEAGAKVRASLVAKAQSLRASNSARQLTEAERASEQMGGPLLAMLLAMLVLVIAPAMAQVLSLT